MMSYAVHKFHKINTISRFLTCQLSTGVKQKWLLLLQQNNIDDPSTAVKEISNHVEKNFKGTNQSSYFETLCQRRLNREPLQYIIGEWDFRYLTLKMSPPVFIPRPETEVLIDLIHKDMIGRRKNNQSLDHINVLEIGCGSGAISLSLLHEIKDVRVVCMDRLIEAVLLTKHNASIYDLLDRIDVLHRPLCEVNLLKDVGGERFDVIVSNPPYIPSHHLCSLQDEVKLYESMVALDGGADGLDTIKVILNKLPLFGKPNSSSLWLEVDESHCELIKQYVKDHHASRIRYVSHYEDCYGRSRFCHLQLKEQYG